MLGLGVMLAVGEVVALAGTRAAVLGTLRLLLGARLAATPPPPLPHPAAPYPTRNIATARSRL
jgi:hypothetical protein